MEIGNTQPCWFQSCSFCILRLLFRTRFVLRVTEQNWIFLSSGYICESELVVLHTAVLDLGLQKHQSSIALLRLLSCSAWLARTHTHTHMDTHMHWTYLLSPHQASVIPPHPPLLSLIFWTSIPHSSKQKQGGREMTKMRWQITCYI